MDVMMARVQFTGFDVLRVFRTETCYKMDAVSLVSRIYNT